MSWRSKKEWRTVPLPGAAKKRKRRRPSTTTVLKVEAAPARRPDNSFDRLLAARLPAGGPTGVSRGSAAEPLSPVVRTAMA
jgi:hypothetical protein